jgi:tetratricopeptide (TPR) repeat protein
VQKAFRIVSAPIVAIALVIASPTSVRTTADAQPGANSGGLTEGPRLSAIYDTILQARFDDARAQLGRACPPAPAPACDALREAVVWWEIEQNPWDRQLAPRMEASAATALASATSWTEREPMRGEAWFYLAAAYGPLTQWRVLRGQRLTAARDGKRIKDALERAVALDSRLQDGWFGIGLYHYYADVAPAALKFLRFLLLLPGGDRAQGLQEMLRARDHGELLQGEADYQLHWVYLWYEHKPDRALQLLRGLDERYPSNPVFLQRIADIQHVYFSDHRASAESWRLLLERAQGGQVGPAAIAEARARVGLAAELVELSEWPRAIAVLDPLVRSRATEPYGVRALAQLTLGDAYAGSGDRVKAIDAYSRAIELAPPDDPDAIRSRARSGVARARSRQ